MSPPLPDGGGSVERKVQVTGGSTYTVSIPKEWANDRDIESGSVVRLYPFDARIVMTQPEARTWTARIDVDAVGEESVSKWIEAAYAAGSDEIRVESDTGFTAAQRRIASGAITDLVGMEIASETETELVARSLLDTAEISLEDTIDQLRGISLSMHEDAVEAVRSADGGELASRVAARDDDVDRLFALVSRQFYRTLDDVRELEKLRTGRRAAFTRFRVARQLERIADHAELIADVGRRQSDPPEAELRGRIGDVATDARRVVRTALDGNTGEALMRRDGVVEAVDELDRRLYGEAGENVYLYGRVLESVRRTAEYGGNVAEIRTLNGIATPDGRTE